MLGEHKTTQIFYTFVCEINENLLLVKIYPPTYPSIHTQSASATP